MIQATIGRDQQAGDAAQRQILMSDIGNRVLAISDERERNRWTQQLVSAWSEQDPEAALNWLQANHERFSDQVYQSVFYRDIAANTGKR